MSLKQRINDDMKAAMRAREAERLGTIRMLLAAMKQREVDERIELDDAAIFAIVEKLIKQRRDASSQFKQAGREDLVAKEEAEIVVLAAYMPAQMSAEEVAAAIADAIAKAGAKGPQDMGKVMGVLKPALAGRADMGAASAQLKTALAALA
ncbi:MAG: GatB/YqeY domain-containing protein [Candidatus Protistobacter heckmanni]|nr:GatB/YqeY domain-containing protein [Candidatus Protistobacter heckmanni]